MFQVEPRVPVRMLVDSSASMTAHGGQKFDYARKLAAALTYVGLVRLDSIEILRLLPAPRAAHRRDPAAGTAMPRRRRWMLIQPCAIEPGGTTDYVASIREFISCYSQRGLVIVISDFLDDNGCERALQYLIDFGHELLLIQIWSDEDRTPPWTGELDLRDAESGAGLKLDFDDKARRAPAYTAAFDGILRIQSERMALRSSSRYAGILHLVVARKHRLRRVHPHAKESRMDR